ncbi:hypothetical protein [Sulfuracidifex tepidarius]|uniref:Uncharacterized protein n=1 Tax=Sulfuracidifex tepidarius TaxID=1294262 RepID=A0A510E1D5_9CREN|nr:hypothetical protein [Sulfuracidifex tepidarius]BBG25980.1 hypothetical protein IC007_0485 [Sulfuracidifex tepidarius]
MGRVLIAIILLVVVIAGVGALFFIENYKDSFYKPTSSGTPTVAVKNSTTPHGNAVHLNLTTSPIIPIATVNQNTLAVFAPLRVYNNGFMVNGTLGELSVTKRETVSLYVTNEPGVSLITFCIDNSSLVQSVGNGKSVIVYPGVYCVIEVLSVSPQELGKPTKVTIQISFSNGTSSLYHFLEVVDPSPKLGIYQGFTSPSFASLFLDTTSWPVYIPPNQLSQYYGDLKNGSYEEPILDLSANYKEACPYSAGIMLYNSSFNGTSYQETFVGTYTVSGYSGSSDVIPADGFEMGAFLTPTNYIDMNHSVSYWVSYGADKQITPLLFNDSFDQGVMRSLAGIQGVVLLPYSPSPYIIVQWDPFWKAVNMTGQFNIWIVNYTDGPQNPPNVVVIPHTGNGTVIPSPYQDLIIKMSYNALTKDLYAQVIDLNNREVANVSVNLGSIDEGDYSFLGSTNSVVANVTVDLPPFARGNYYSFIGADTGQGFANWGVLWFQ